MHSKRLLITTALSLTALLGAVGAASLPAAASTTSGKPSLAGRVNPGGPVVRASVPGTSNSGLPTISLNWSGYAATSSQQFTYVHVRFTQPKITCVGKVQYTSNWSGLDGLTNSTVEQDGTDAFCGGSNHKTPKYRAWYEMFPAGSVSVFSVRPGDTIDSSVRFANGKFRLRIADLTRGISVTKVGACSSCARSSAEWIVERPALCTNKTCTKAFLTMLAHFQTTTMAQAQAQVAGGKVSGIAAFDNVPIFMISLLKKGFISLDNVSPLSSSGDAFSVTWERAGKPFPISL
jgi:Peptidase A4 family